MERAWIDDQRVTAQPPTGFTHVVVGLDPADGTASGAEQALVVAGLGLDRQFYVLHSEGMRDTPLRWLMRAVAVAREYGATRLVLEKNFGGRALIDVLEQAFDRTGGVAPAAYFLGGHRPSALPLRRRVLALWELASGARLTPVRPRTIRSPATSSS